MAGRRGDGGDDVSLFPFLSIIACVIGVLTLLISALALAQMGNDDVATLEQYENAQRELEAIKRELEELRSQLDEDILQRAKEVDDKQRELAANKRRLEDLLAEIIKLRQALEQGPGETVDMPKIDPQLKQRVVELQEELSGVKEQIAQLEKQLEERKSVPTESEVTVMPGGSGVGFKPVFVECTSNSVVLHSEADLKRVLTANLADDPTFLKILARVAGAPNTRLVFLIRSDGLNTYRKAHELAVQYEVTDGKLPVIGNGRLDLSAFRD